MDTLESDYSSALPWRLLAIVTLIRGISKQSKRKVELNIGRHAGILCNPSLYKAAVVHNGDEDCLLMARLLVKAVGYPSDTPEYQNGRSLGELILAEEHPEYCLVTSADKDEVVRFLSQSDKLTQVPPLVNGQVVYVQYKCTDVHQIIFP